jgi:hypothetical protein
MSTRLNSTSEQSGRHAPPATAPTGAAQIDIDVVIPVHDEQATLERSIRCLHAFLTTEMRSPWRIVIADNASADATSQIARTLADELVHVTSLRLEEKLSGHAELAIGTRLAPGANVTRGLKRELISRSYNRLVQIALRARFSDAQCGFTAARRDVLDELLAEVRDQGWFFDTELLVAAEHRGLRIHEVPVDWTDDSDSSAAIVSTALADLCGVARLVRARRAGPRPVARSRAVGSIAQTGPAEPRR